MENNSSVPQFQPAATSEEPPVSTPQPQTSGVWLSQEEYQRLQHEAAQPRPVGSHTTAAPVYMNEGKKNLWTYIGGAAAVLIFLGMSYGTATVFTGPLVIALLIFIILAIKSLVKPPSNEAYASTFAAPSRKTSAGKIVLTVLLLLLLIPVMPYALLIIFLLIMLASGQNPGT